MSSPSPVPLEAAEGEPVAECTVPRRAWSPWSELRTDLRRIGIAVAALAVAGLPAGLAWWWLAPRAVFRITSDGPTPVGNPSVELFAADDVVFTLVLAGLGLLAGLLLWLRPGFRGLGALVALAVGMTAAGALAWLVGGLLGPDPGRSVLHDVGARVRTGLNLESLAALAVGPFVALLVYVVAAVLVGSDDLGRRRNPAPAPDAPVS